jgi:hypothetical protein
MIKLSSYILNHLSTYNLNQIILNSYNLNICYCKICLIKSGYISHKSNHAKSN